MPLSIAQHPPQMPLMLPQPRIAGLLPARVDSASHPNVFTYTNPELDKLRDVTRVTLNEAAARLLDGAVRYLTDKPDETILLEAELRFHEALIAVHAPPEIILAHSHLERRSAPSKHVIPTQEELDAEIEEFLIGAAERVKEAGERAKRKWATW